MSNPKFKVGDRVVLNTDKFTGLPSSYKSVVLTLGERQDGSDSTFYIDDDSGYVVNTAWIKPAPTFKIGDRVRISGSPSRNGEFTLTDEKITYTGNVTDYDGDYWAGVGVCLGHPGKDGRVFEKVVAPANPVVYRAVLLKGEVITSNSGQKVVLTDGGCESLEGWVSSKEDAVAAAGVK